MIADESLPMAAPLTIGAVLILLFASLLAFLIDRRRRRRHYPSAESPSSELKTVGETPLLQPPLSSVGGEEGEKQRVEDGRKKKRGRKKRTEIRLEGGEDAVVGCTSELGERDFPNPFSSYSSATQRKIKMKYDELVKSNQEKALTMAQVYKLEAEHRRLVEDAAVYNLLQEQLRLSPAYKTILEIGASMEPKNPVEEAAEFSDISFEELLAREKKDSFWHKNGKLRTATN